ncbi:MAG: HAMP domain-containing histidine kinase [Acidobacteria bacterium]|nr:HAMP domain-containing histidine kinase [Acidobacteriota bacterium]MBV9067632.1 HAMP domain-containing histidine kinase [Acidobacteriota bacterium]MBV9188240.1 HAMP domain-containing histidine kinase [Acidobacteriota bacterium]
MNPNENYVIAKHLKTPIAIVNEHGGVEWRNDAFATTFGSDAKDWLTQAARTVAGERGWLQGFFHDADAHRSLDVDIEGRTYRVDKIMQADDYTVPAVALWFEDVTRQREAEQAKSDFTAQIVHDLRGPLSGIQGTLEFVLSQETSKMDALHLDLLTEAQRESERMMSLINEIMDFSKIQSGSFAVEQEPVRIAGLLKRAVRSLQSVASRDEVFLLSAHGRDVPQIIGSVEKLTQAVINLISNSLKFTPKKGLISVGAQIIRNGDLPEAIVITVTDSGMGIKAVELQQIWDKYKQSGNKSLRGGGGTGLGLYIVKQVVEAHGGEVTVASIEGVGTSMVLKLPVTRAA